jgi:ubiquitin C-terminal hydrolase
MTDSDIHDAIGRRDYTSTAKFETSDGRIIGLVRHSGKLLAGKFRSEMLRGGAWHYHETDGVSHCTRSILASEIVGPA